MRKSNRKQTLTQAVFSSIICSYLAHFLSPSSKNKYINKNPVREMELSGSDIKKFLIFSYILEIELSSSIIFSKESFSYISGNRNPEKIL